MMQEQGGSRETRWEANASEKREMVGRFIVRNITTGYILRRQ